MDFLFVFVVLFTGGWLAVPVIKALRRMQAGNVKTGARHGV